MVGSAVVRDRASPLDIARLLSAKYGIANLDVIMG
jgi:hypothetical protein